MIAHDPFASTSFTGEERICRFCGYECGLVGTGCEYIGQPYRRYAGPVYSTATTIVIFAPSKDEPSADLGPELPKKPLKTQKPSPVAFVGGGAMRRRWR